MINMKNFLFTFAACCLAVSLSFCATVHQGPSVCGNLETMEQSWLCRAASGSGLPLEEYGYIILDAEAVGLITEEITAEQVKVFCADMRALLQTMRGRLSYTGLISEVLKDAKQKAIFHLVSRRLIVFNSDFPISDMDIGFLIWQLGQIEYQV